MKRSPFWIKFDGFLIAVYLVWVLYNLVGAIR